ncbi:MAG: IMS domain-containing protein [bacterium]
MTGVKSKVFACADRRKVDGPYMKLPLDNFQILGVSPRSDRNMVLTVLQKKLENCDFAGFSKETMDMRAKLLRDIGEVLSQEEKRRQYERNYVQQSNEDSRLVAIEQDSEVAGLLLMLEAGQYQDILTYSQKVALSHKNKQVNKPHDDWVLLQLYTILCYSKELFSKRFYESSSELVERGLAYSSTTSTGQQIQTELKMLSANMTPYKILDLVSRNSTDTQHKEGLRLLECMVEDRGGLDIPSDKCMKNLEFQAFFRQIREYLTLQEQIEMFRRWGLEGSRVALFLASIALVALGYSQRKPDKILEALTFIESIREEGLEPIIANMHLLLGNIDESERLFYQWAENDLKGWCEYESDTVLGQLCAWCQEWLSRDVLIGYRDLEASANLDEYYSDKDVTTFIEEHDGRMILENKPNRPEKKGFQILQKKSDTYLQKTLIRDNLEEASHLKPDKKLDSLKNKSKVTDLDRFTHSKTDFEKLVIRLLVISMLGSLAVFSLTMRSNVPTMLSVHEKNVRDGEKDKRYPSQNIKGEFALKENNDNGSYKVLSEWLDIKSESLKRGSIPNHISRVASPELIQALRKEINEHQYLGHKLLMKPKIIRVNLIKSDTNKKIMEATLEYSDVTIDKKGREISRTSSHVFKRNYTLINQGGKWLVLQ